MNRRQALRLAAGTVATTFAVTSKPWQSGEKADLSMTPDAASVIPVVGDGKWIWTEPPKTDRGYLEPRPYTLEIGIELEGAGNASGVMAATPIPVKHPEQQIDDFKVETVGCEAAVRETAPGAGQLILSAATIAAKQVISAVVTYKLTLLKQYQGYQKEQFPAKQEPPSDVQKAALQDSPGIQTSAASVKKLAAELIDGVAHPWDRAKAFAEWVPRNIKPQIGPYTSVTAALETRRGDCEEMSAVFIALCRAVGIPARVVWVPNHNWSEFYLTDDKGQGHWIPVHTACYGWFGWTGAHELVLQKGDRVHVPEQHRSFRLLEDWLHCGGKKPAARYIAELVPQPATEGADAGPGARRKEADGQWKLFGKHELDHYGRQ